MPKTTVCFVAFERPLGGRIPCTKTNNKGNFDFTVLDIPDKYRVCASTSDSIVIFVGNNHRVTCSNPMLWGIQDESRKVILKFKSKEEGQE